MSLLENIKEKDFLGDIGVNGTTIWTWMLQQWEMKIWIKLNWIRIEWIFGIHYSGEISDKLNNDMYFTERHLAYNQ
jgi:hypothetical protein